ncbi:MAG TPA: hypothetical protein VN708_21535 [Terriglobales bacterium]|nr:hypothetical protein [Terriglobales bacterium]
MPRHRPQGPRLTEIVQHQRPRAFEICHPVGFNNTTTIDSPFQVISSGTGAGGAVKRMEVWVDYQKVNQASGNLFDSPVSLTSGNHRLVVVELDSTGAYLKSSPLMVTIQNTANQPCDPPSGPGVNVCDPAPGSCHTTPWTTISAASTGASGSVRRMELWSGGVKLANFPGNTIHTNLYLPDFSTVTIVEVDSAGGLIKSPRTTVLSR